MSDWRPDLGSGVETCPSPFHVVKTRRAVVSLAQGDDNQDRTFGRTLGLQQLEELGSVAVQLRRADSGDLGQVGDGPG